VAPSVTDPVEPSRSIPATLTAVDEALRRQAGTAAATTFTAARACGSYDELLQLALTTVDVT
jgi:hypothetical protein